MIAIPLAQRWQRVKWPWLTLGLVLVNVVVFFGWQYSDYDRYRAFARFYGKSSLPAVEIPAYRNYLAAQGRAAEIRSLDKMPPQAGGYVGLQIQRDRAFIAALTAQPPLAAGSADFQRWQRDRAQADLLAPRFVSEGYALQARDGEPLQWLTHMFLHGGIDHLLGNMLFLFLFGILVEQVVARTFLLGAYLLTGVAAAATYVFAHPETGAGLVGASGAIAGLMGLLAALYWSRKLRFFYWVIVVVGVVEASAMWLFLFWLGHELLQLFTASPWNRVAYEAHFGGLCAGLAIGAAYRWLAAGRLAEAFARQDEQTAKVFDASAVEHEARDAIRRLDLAAARRAYGRLAKHHPQERRYLAEYWRLASAEPTSSDYVRAAERILRFRVVGSETDQWVCNVFRDAARVLRGRLSTEGLILILPRLGRIAALPEGEAVVRELLARNVRDPRVRAGIDLLVKAFEAAGKPAKAQQILGWGELMSEAAHTSPALAAARVPEPQ